MEVLGWISFPNLAKVFYSDSKSFTNDPTASASVMTFISLIFMGLQRSWRHFQYSISALIFAANTRLRPGVIDDSQVMGNETELQRGKVMYCKGVQVMLSGLRLNHVLVSAGKLEKHLHSAAPVIIVFGTCHALWVPCDRNTENSENTNSMGYWWSWLVTG